MTSNNITQANTSGCKFPRDVVFSYWFYSTIVGSVASVIGNCLIILTIYKTKTLRTTTNIFIVNMAVSDVFQPAFHMLYFALFDREDAPVLTQALGTALCKLLAFFINTSYGVSMSSLVVITVDRFYAVVFPMRARLESRSTRALLLVCTWLLPIAVHSQPLYYSTYNSQRGKCSLNMRGSRRLIWDVTFLVPFVALPFLLMLVLYPVIIVKLVRQKVPGNLSSTSQLIRRRKRNIRLTKMFITITVALLLTYGNFQIAYVIYFHSRVSNQCALRNFYSIIYPLPVIFHAINPVLYFLFCPCYRHAIKQIFSCCCRRLSPPGGRQI